MGKIGMIMVGCGGIANAWIPVIRENPDVELLAACDPIPSRFEKLKKGGFENVPTYSDLELAFAEHDADATLILTPPQYHPRYLIESIQNECHVITEKPFFTNMNDYMHLRSINEMAKEAGLVAVVNQQYRWMPRCVSIRTAIEQGIIGDISFVVSNFCQNRYHFNSWWRQQDRDISQLNWYIHHYDTMRFYLNSNPVEVRARMVKPNWSKIIGESTIFLNVKFANGIEWAYNATQEGVAGYEDSGHTTFTMYGSKGTIRNTRDAPPMAYLETGNPKKPEEIELGDFNPDENLLKYPPGWNTTLGYFVDAVKGGAPHPTRFDDNFYTMAIPMCARESQRLGGAPVRVSEFMGLD
jgi:predicted dehydrogenase